jgi:hypothetical protein
MGILIFLFSAVATLWAMAIGSGMELWMLHCLTVLMAVAREIMCPTLT